MLGILDDQFHKSGVVGFRIVDEGEICRAGFVRWVENAAVGIDLEHLDDSFGVHAESQQA